LTAGGPDQSGKRRRAWAEIDLGAIRHNARVLTDVAAPARLCAVVKAGGYGHGAVEVARAALDGGASWLAVAVVEEGLELRAAGLAGPVLLLSQPPPAAMPEVIAGGLTPTIYTREGLDALRSALRAAGPGRPCPVHIKVDTGMHRVGADADQAIELARAVAGDRDFVLEGFWTHLAVADEIDDPYTAGQVVRYQAALDTLAAAGVRPTLRHAANSAGAMWHPTSRYDLVRCGIALYGLAPDAADIDRCPANNLRGALTLKARVSHVRTLASGERLSYGLRYRLERDSVIATVPIGYADGVTRALAAVGGEVLIGGSRRPIAGTVTMDQLMVDCGPAAAVSVGDEVVLVGSQGSETITAWDWAVRTGTIAYEVVCGVSGRVPRVYVGGDR
jgi:alanine racemase